MTANLCKCFCKLLRDSHVKYIKWYDLSIVIFCLLVFLLGFVRERAPCDGFGERFSWVCEVNWGRGMSPLLGIPPSNQTFTLPYPSEVIPQQSQSLLQLELCPQGPPVFTMTWRAFLPHDKLPFYSTGFVAQFQILLNRIINIYFSNVAKYQNFSYMGSLAGIPPPIFIDVVAFSFSFSSVKTVNYVL